MELQSFKPLPVDTSSAGWLLALVDEVPPKNQVRVHVSDAGMIQ